MHSSGIFYCICFCVMLPLIVCQSITRHNLLDFPIEPPENLVNIIKSNGYPAEEHETTTDDGYILKIYRIPNIKSTKLNKPPVFIMHGLATSAGDFVNVHPNISLGYVLWNAGYDVWLGNARGNNYSKKHKNIDENKNAKEFYNFSWHEIGIYDLPAIIDYIISETHYKKIYYIGYSQGGTAFYVAMSSRPEYNEKIRLALLMSPAGLENGLTSPAFLRLARNQDLYKNLTNGLNIYHIPFLDTVRGFIRNICSFTENYDICKELFLSVTGYIDDDQLNPQLLPMIFRTCPSDISLKQIDHYLQIIRSGKFCEYDYGPIRNMKIYGQDEPPEYNISKITAPVAIYYGENDRIVNATDVRKFIKRLPNIIMEYVVPHETFNHLDFLWAKDIYRLLHVVMLKLLKKY